MERRYSKSDFCNGKFYQLGKELFKGQYKGMSNNERVIYSVLKDRFELSILNGWVDENNDIYFYFDQNQLADECCVSRSTVQRSLNILIEYILIDSVRQGVNLPNRLYLLKPEIKDMETIAYTNTDEKRKRQNEASGSIKMKHPDASKRCTIYTEKNDTEYISSSMAESSISGEDQEGEESYEYLSFDGSTEKITCSDDIVKYIDDKTNIESDELSSQLCKRVRGIMIQIFNPLDHDIKQFRADGKIIELDLDMRKKLYRVISPKLFQELVLSIQNNPEPIKSLKAFVLACLYNYANSSTNNCRIRAAPANMFNNMMENQYDFEKLEAELLGFQK